MSDAACRGSPDRCGNPSIGAREYNRRACCLASASELIARQGKHPQEVQRQLAAWEEWAADLLQDELSYPMLAYFRSQHLNQSWIGALVAMTDTSALLMLSAEGELQHQAQATFAMARHTLIDSTKVLRVNLPHDTCERLSPEDLRTIREMAVKEGAAVHAEALDFEKVSRVLQSYEQYSSALSDYLLMALPPLLQKDSRDNWKVSSRQGATPLSQFRIPFKMRTSNRLSSSSPKFRSESAAKPPADDYVEAGQACKYHGTLITIMRRLPCM